MAAKEQVAALQARVRELEDDRSAWKEIAQDWSAAAKLAEQPEKFYEGYSAAVMNAMQALLTKARAELTQRTAELEAANDKVQFLEKKNRNLLDSENLTLKVKADQDVRLADLQAELERVRGELAKMRERKDGAYLERNRVVAALASCFPSGISRTAIEGWHDDWHGCVYIDLPTGQVSWHYHDSHAHLFAHLPPYTKQWDGHTTEEKYERVALLQHRQGMEG